MDEPVAFLIEWKAHEPPEYRCRLQFDAKLDPWMIDAAVQAATL